MYTSRPLFWQNNKFTHISTQKWPLCCCCWQRLITNGIFFYFMLLCYFEIEKPKFIKIHCDVFYHRSCVCLPNSKSEVLHEQKSILSRILSRATSKKKGNRTMWLSDNMVTFMCLYYEYVNKDNSGKNNTKLVIETSFYHTRKNTQKKERRGKLFSSIVTFYIGRSGRSAVNF